MPANALSTGSLLVACLCMLGMLAWAGFCFARWYRADGETRISLRQARRIQWGWKRLAPMLDLVVKDATPTVLQQLSPQDLPAKPRGWRRACTPKPTRSASPSPRMPSRRWG